MAEKQSLSFKGKVGGARPGAGRKKGVPNKMTKELKEMILGALDDAGGQEYLARQAEETPAAFMTLLGKVLPLQLTGANGGPIEYKNLSDQELDEKLCRLADAIRNA